MTNQMAMSSRPTLAVDTLLSSPLPIHLNLMAELTSWVCAGPVALGYLSSQPVASEITWVLLLGVTTRKDVETFPFHITFFMLHNI